MTERYRVNDWVKYQYSEIGEYIGEGYTDKPLRNDELVKILNLQDKQIKELEEYIRVNTTNKMTTEDVSKECDTMTEDKPYKLVVNDRGQLDIIDGIEFCIYNDLGIPPFSAAKSLCKLLNEKEETIQDLLKYKYLVKALEEINKKYIEELISDWTNGAYSDKEEQLQLGKYHSENGLSWENGDVE